jgi:hypothetical protein
LISPIGKYSMATCLLGQRVDEPCGDEDDFIDLALQEQVARHRRNCPGLGKPRCVAIREISDELSPRARHELGSLAACRDEDG